MATNAKLKAVRIINQKKIKNLLKINLAVQGSKLTQIFV